MPAKLTWSGIFILLLILWGGQTLLWQSFAVDDIRPTAFAGAWYPGNPHHLSEVIKKFYSHVNSDEANTAHRQKLDPEEPLAPFKGARLVALVSPHAAFPYSGQAQAYVFDTLAKVKPKRLIILAACHSKLAHKGVVLCSNKYLATPLGKLTVDQQAMSKLASQKHFAYEQNAQNEEHSIEMQLPFVAKSMPDCQIVPLIVGKIQTAQEVQAIAASIKKIMEPDDIILVSSDFTHYGNFYHYVPFTKDIPAKILKLDQSSAGYLKRLDVPGFMQFKKQTGDTICGFTACLVMMALISDQPTTMSVLDYYTSDDAMGTTVNSPAKKSISYISLAYWR